MRVDDIMQEKKIYVDLDGVLVDFDKGVRQFGINPLTSSASEVFAHINKVQDAGIPWFLNLDPKEDAFVLWDYLKQFNPIVLTATGYRYDEVSIEKIAWVKKHLGIPRNRIITVQRSELKAQYASNLNDILIDDSPRSINPWRAAGGTGILHTDAISTIAALSKI